MSIGVSIVVKCGHYDSLSAGTGFIECKEALSSLANTIDVEKESSTTVDADKIELLQKVKDFSKMTDKLRGVLRAAKVTCGDSILHSAACGDVESKNTLLEKPEVYIHKIAIAGYLPLLTAIIQIRPDLVKFIDSDTGRTPLINAAWGGSSKCLKYLAANGARLDSKDKDNKTALSYAQQFKNFFCVKFLKNKVPQSFFIKHAHTKRFVRSSIHQQLILEEFSPKAENNDNNPFLFRFVDDQLQHVLSGKYAHPIHGRKGPGVSVGLSDDSDGERTSCFPFDFDPSRCLLAGGDNYFVKVNRNYELEWHKFWGTKDENNPFDSRNGFEFKIIQANVSYISKYMSLY
jgi:hypothetical protein